MKSPPINENNLLRFTSITEPTTALQSTYGYALHSGNRKWRRSVLNPLPALKGETYTFYTNFDTPTFNLADIKLVYDDNCVYTEIVDINEPSIEVTAWGDNNFKIALTVPATASENKFIKVVESSTEEINGYATNSVFNSLLGGTINSIKKLSGGRLGICGAFTYNSNFYLFLVVNEDGTLTSFDTLSKFNSTVNDFVEQTDGKIICVGDFTDYDGSTSNRIIRLNTDGTKDNTFDIGTGASSELFKVAVDVSGNIATYGYFFWNGSGTATNCIRLSTLGVLQFNYDFIGNSNDIAFQSDGKLIRAINGSGAVIRYLTDGTEDFSFTTSFGASAGAFSLKVDGSDKIYVGGNSALDYLRRLNSDGTTDLTFTPALNNLVTFVDVDGAEVLIRGSFTTINAQSISNTAVLNTSGVVDIDKNFIGVDDWFYGKILKVGESYLVSNSDTITYYDPIFVPVVGFTSNLFMVLPLNEDTINNTHLFSFYHNTNIYGYEWAIYDPLTDTPYTVRIPSTKKGVEYPREVSTYESATSGRSRNTRAINRKDESFQIYFREDADHDAVATLINFKYLWVNQKQYLPIDAYEPEYNDSFNIYVGNLKLRDVAYSVRINGCT